MYSLLPTAWICLLRSIQTLPAICIIYPVTWLVPKITLCYLVYGILVTSRHLGFPAFLFSVALFKMINCLWSGRVFCRFS